MSHQEMNRTRNLNAIHKNMHSWKHRPQCFKYSNECRYHFPKLPQQITDIVTQYASNDWSEWNGEKCPYTQYKIISQRSQHDLFMNSYCTAVANCKALAGSNSNSQICIDGQQAFYVTKYPTKSTQEEDASEYARVHAYCQSRLEQTRYDVQLSEALSRVIGASLAHIHPKIIQCRWNFKG